MDGESGSQLRDSDPKRVLLALASRQAVASDAAAVPRARAKRLRKASRLVIFLAALGIAATLLAGAVGYQVARDADARFLSDQRASLRSAAAEFRALFGQPDDVDQRFVHMVEQSAGLKALKFETETPGDSREVQPVLDGRGRIAGFFTWEKTRPMAAAMGRLLPFIVAVALLLVVFAAYSLRQINRARGELAASEDLVRRAADEDKITSLPNHAKSLELLDLALAERGEADVTSFALIELDGMADVTAHLGVLGADELIVAVARRIKEMLPPQAICGRIAADEFAVTLSAGPEIDVEAVMRGTLQAIARPHWIDKVVRVSAHAGFAQAPRDAETRGELTRKAELALREAARKGPGSLVRFETALEAASADQKFIHRELPRALSAGDLDLHYQPIVAGSGGRVVGLEALLRWTHATRGAIAPAAFIPVAEQMGLMDALGAFVLRRALAEAKRWPDLYIAVNLSPLQVRDVSIVELVRSALAESAVPPSRLVLEITEGVLIDNPDEVIKRIEDLHALGVRIALDDFGSGYSNLGYLQRFPLDKLKIDKSFVDALGQSANGGVIIQAIVALARALGLTVTVEGVETEQQRVLLRLAGCDEMQGFLFARPAPARAIDRLLAQMKADAGKALPAAAGALTA